MGDNRVGVTPERRNKVQFDGLSAASHAPTWGQYGMWKTTRRIGVDASGWNQSRILEVSDGVDEADIYAALAKVAGRHESLRTVFTEPEPDQPLAEVQPAGAIWVSHYPYTSESGNVDEFVQRVAEAERRITFDSAIDLPLNAAVVDGPDSRKYLVVTCSHVVVDNYAMGLLERELGSLLTGGAEPVLPPVELQPSDITKSEASEEGIAENNRSIKYWLEALAKAPVPSPPVPSEGEPDSRSTSLAIINSATIPKALTTLAARHSSIPSSVLLAATSMALADVTDSSSVFFQVICHNRSSEAARQYIGCLVQGGPFYLQTDQLSFTAAIPAAERAAMNAFLHARYDTATRDAAVAEVESVLGTRLDIRLLVGDELSMHLPMNDPKAETALSDTGGFIKESTITHTLVEEPPSERISLYFEGDESAARVAASADPRCFTPEELGSLLDTIETVLAEACSG